MQHEGTSAEVEESRLVGLYEHMGWTDQFAHTVAERVVSRGWATVHEEWLVLTPAGRGVARAAVGEPSPA